MSNPDKTALVLIDLQGGNMDHPHLPISSQEVVDASVDLLQGARSAGVFVVHVRTSFLPDESDSLQPLEIERMRPTRPVRPLGWDEIVPEAEPSENEPVIVK